MITEPLRWERMTPAERARARKQAERICGESFTGADMQYFSDYNIERRMGFEEFEREWHEREEIQ